MIGGKRDDQGSSCFFGVLKIHFSHEQSKPRKQVVCSQSKSRAANECSGQRECFYSRHKRKEMEDEAVA